MLRFLGLLLLGAVLGPAQTLQGKLVDQGGRPALESNHHLVLLQGDEDTEKVLHDQRLQGLDIEARGHAIDADHFAVAPSYTKNLLVHKDGKRFMITYWCPVCSIRTYVPGKCMCCQQETHLDLQESDEK